MLYECDGAPGASPPGNGMGVGMPGEDARGSIVTVNSNTLIRKPGHRWDPSALL
jgi:hypothetical protein